ncbi:HEPN domain-containing protein, partial [Sneathiella sp.]|uniref:HEPN domain-containing protein n=1 Tax=Sneathiella sp. TaxID=1964365 RepID=UPI003567356F
LTVDELLSKARMAVRSSQLLLDADDLDGACNRAYYAMFDAARAALLATGTTPSLASIKTHSGLISAFSLQLVKTGKVSVDLGKAINKVEDLRLVADYKGDIIEVEQVAWAQEQARVFVATMEKLIDDLPPLPTPTDT